MKNIIMLALMICSFGAIAQQKPLVATVPTSGNLTLTRAEIKLFLVQVKQEMANDTIDTPENIIFKKALEDALVTKFTERTIKGVPAKFVKKLASNLSGSLMMYETSRRDMERLTSICVEWKSTGDTALNVLEGGYFFDTNKIKSIVRRGKLKD